MIYPKKSPPMSKKAWESVEIEPMETQLSHTRYRNGNLVPKSAAGYSGPRIKREWSFKGTHIVKLKDGTTVTRDGQYVPKIARP